MTHTADPPRCPNPDCRALLESYQSVQSYTRVSVEGTSVALVTCTSCGTFLGMVPVGLDKLKT